MTDQERLKSQLSQMRSLFRHSSFQHEQEKHIKGQMALADNLRDALKELEQVKNDLAALREAIARLL